MQVSEPPSSIWQCRAGLCDPSPVPPLGVRPIRPKMPQEIQRDALDLAALIRDGDHIVWGQGAGEPATLVEKLLEQRHRIGHASVFLGGLRSRRTLLREHADVLSFTSLGAIGSLRGFARDGLLQNVPCHLSQIPAYFERGILRCADVCLRPTERTRPAR